MNARKQYLEELGKEYQRVDEGGRSRLLDEAEKRTGLHRKYLIRILNHPPGTGTPETAEAASRVRRRGDDGAGGGVGHIRTGLRAADGGGAAKRAGATARAG